jgi:hypothetical protein
VGTRGGTGEAVFLHGRRYVARRKAVFRFAVRLRLQRERQNVTGRAGFRPRTPG